MNLGLSLGLGSRGSAADANLVLTVPIVLNGAPTHSEQLGPTSFRAARDAVTNGNVQFNLSPGTYRVTGDLSVYDGAVAGITINGIVFLDGGAFETTISNPQAFDLTFTIATNLIFANSGAGRGYRVDNLRIVPA